MITANRRTTLKWLAGTSIAAATTTGLAFPAAAEKVDPVVPTKYENFKRGTINSLDPKTRGLTVIWDDKGRVKMKASDLVVKDTVGNAYSELKDGQTVDIHWYDYLDFLVAKGSPSELEAAKAMVTTGARVEGIPGTEHQIRLFTTEGTVTKLDPATYTMSIVYAAGGEPDKGVPAAGEVIQLPQILTAQGQAAFKTLKPGDHVVVVFSVQTAMKIKIIR
jgi:Cu/Ag efflux protein CusF